MDIKTIDFHADDAPKAFSDALNEIGFAVIENHEVSPDLLQRVHTQWLDFFLHGDREGFNFDPKTHDGLIGMSLSETAKGYDIKDIKEFYHYYKGMRCPDALRADTDALYDGLTELAYTLLDWTEAGTPAAIRDKFSRPLRDMVRDCPKTLQRILHYPPLKGDEPAGSVRAAAHEDINLLTMLPAANAAGLEVLGKDGKWISAPYGSNAIIVNIGDMLQEASDGYYPSTTHRVVNPVGNAAQVSRVSMPLFLHAHADVVLSERHTAESYRQERYGELGLDDKS